MTSRLDPERAARVLHHGGVIAYPTEAVWGLGCDPCNRDAVLRLLAIKQREIGKGVILVAASLDQLAQYVYWDELPERKQGAVLDSWPGPHTWILPANPGAPHWITGDHDGIAARISAHPVVLELCMAFGGALVSTSANLAGAPPPKSVDAFDPDLLAALDGIVQGEVSGLDRPTAIRDARTGDILRT